MISVSAGLRLRSLVARHTPSPADHNSEEEEEEEEETREDDTMKNIRARNEVARRREKEVTRAMFRAFKSGDVEADVNPLLRARGVDGGMSRTNPLRRLRG